MSGRMKTALLWKHAKAAEASPESVVSVIVGDAAAIDGIRSGATAEASLGDNGNESGAETMTVRVIADALPAIDRGDVVRVDGLPYYASSIAKDSAGAIVVLTVDKKRPHEADFLGESEEQGWTW